MIIIKNKLLYKFISKVNLNIKGPMIERFIKRLKNNNIEIYNILYLNKDEINIKVLKKDYKKIIKLKTIYDIKILDYYGVSKLNNDILQNKFIIISLIICLIFLYIITNLIFSIDIMSNDTSLKEKLYSDLNNLGLSKYKFKKSYIELEKIKKNILEKYNDKIEWIEIESIGTKYIVRYEPRIINKEKKESEYRNIIAKKDCTIKKIYVKNGQIIKGINSYVKKGDVIVSGYISLNDTVKDTISSEGIIYGEVWYKMKINYPLKYYEEYLTGNSKNVLMIQFLNNKIDLFNFKKYKTKKVSYKTLLKNNILPIKFIYSIQNETNVINDNLNEKDALNKAINYSKNKIKSNLKNKEYISSFKVLEQDYDGDSIYLNIFFSVIEDVGEYEIINEYNNIEK